MSLKFYLLNLPLVLTWCIQLCRNKQNENDPFNFLFLKNVPKTHFRREIIRCMLVTAVIWQPDRVRLLTNINHLKRPELRWTASNTDEACLALAGDRIMQWLSKISAKTTLSNWWLTSKISVWGKRSWARKNKTFSWNTLLVPNQNIFIGKTFLMIKD